MVMKGAGYGNSFEDAPIKLDDLDSNENLAASVISTLEKIKEIYEMRFI